MIDAAAEGPVATVARPRDRLNAPGLDVEWPDKGPSPIDVFIKRGSLVYHHCDACNDPEEAVRRMAAAGLDVLAVAPAKPATLIGGERVSFQVVRDFGLIELIERPGKGKGASS